METVKPVIKKMTKFKAFISLPLLICSAAAMLGSENPVLKFAGIIGMIYHYLLTLDVRNDIIEAKLDVLLPRAKVEDESNGQ